MVNPQFSHGDMVTWEASSDRPPRTCWSVGSSAWTKRMNVWRRMVKICENGRTKSEGIKPMPIHIYIIYIYIIIYQYGDTPEATLHWCWTCGVHYFSTSLSNLAIHGRNPCQPADGNLMIIGSGCTWSADLHYISWMYNTYQQSVLI